MACRQYKKWINEYLDGDLTHLREIEAHNERCPACAAYFRQMTQIRTALQISEQAVPDGFSAAWQKRLAKKPAKRKLQYKILIPALAGALCCVFVITAFATGGFTIHSQSSVMMERAGSKTAIEQEEAPEAAPEAPQPAGAGEEEQETQAGEGRMESELTEDTAGSKDAGAEAPAADEAASPSPALSAFSVATPPERVEAAQADRQEFLEKADEYQIAYQLDGNTVLLTEDGKGNIDRLLADFDLSRENSDRDVEVVFTE